MHGSPRFSGIDDGGYLGKSVEVTPMNSLRIAEQVRVVGLTFSGNAASPDPQYWTPGITGTGTVTQPYGQLALTTTGAGVGTATCQSRRIGRYIWDNLNCRRFRFVLTATGHDVLTRLHIRQKAL